MALRLFNTLSRAVETFAPLDPAGKRVGMYCCGPTVYDFPHIGNFRTFVFADLVRRYLQFKGYTVCHVMNVTDVDDRIIAHVREAKVSLREYTSRYEQAFLEDAQALNLAPPHFRPRATEHVAEIIALIERLLARGVAYQAADGAVYFSIANYQAAGHRYGQLLALNLDQMRPGERIQSDNYEKESMADFALWKARAPADGAVFWPSPWGEGRPGWHIECSAMSAKLLGPSFDLHLGGEDLVFPHHEDEIAQTEGAGLPAPGQRFVKYWLHGAHLMVEGRKMAKSLRNFYTLRELLAKGFTAREVRQLLLTAHYREPFNFTQDGLLGARAALARLDECLAKLRALAGTAAAAAAPEEPLLEQFAAALDDDLNVSAAWAAIFEWVRCRNRQLAEGAVTPARAAAALAAWEKLDTVLGLGVAPEPEAPPEVARLLQAREAARRARDFPQADALRSELKAAGWLIEDTPKGPRLKRA